MPPASALCAGSSPIPPDFGKRDVITIPTRLDRQEALARLARLIRASVEPRRFSGEISGASFRLKCCSLGDNSAMRPQFTGTVESVGSGSEVRGDFALPDATRRFLSRAFLFGVVWTVLAVMSVLLMPSPPVLRLLPLGGICMLLLMYLFARFAQSYYRDDRAKLTRAISEELNG